MSAILCILIAGCSTSYHSRGIGTEGYDDIVVQTGSGCRDPRPGNCNFVGFTASESTDDAVIRTYWRRRVAEICGGPVASGDQAIKQWIEQNRVSIDRSGVPVDSASIPVENITWDKSVSVAPRTAGDPQNRNYTGQQKVYVSGKRVEGLIHCPTK